MLERQIEILRQNPGIGMVYSDCYTSGSDLLAGSHFARVGAPARGRVFEQFVTNCNVFTPTVVVRRECLADVGLFNESLQVSEDFNLWLRTAAKWEVEVVSKPLTIRHIRPNSLSLSTSPEVVLRCGIASFENVIQACPSLLPHETVALRRATATRIFQSGSYLLVNGRRFEARQQMFNAMRYGRYDWRVLGKICLSFLPHRAFTWLSGIKQVWTANGAPESGG